MFVGYGRMYAVKLWLGARAIIYFLIFFSRNILRKMRYLEELNSLVMFLFVIMFLLWVAYVCRCKERNCAYLFMCFFSDRALNRGFTVLVSFVIDKLAPFSWNEEERAPLRRSPHETNTCSISLLKTHAISGKSFEYVWSFCGVGTERVKRSA